MKRFSAVTQIMRAILIVGALALHSVALAAPDFIIQPVVPSINPNSLVMANITCGVGGSIKFVNTNNNQVSYWVEYTNKGDAVDYKYTIKGSTEDEVIVNSTTSTAHLKNGSGNITLPNGKITGFFTVPAKTADRVSVEATINGKKCTTKEFSVLKSAPAVSPIAPITPINPVITPIQPNLGGVVVSPTPNNGGNAPAPQPDPAPAAAQDQPAAAPAMGSCKVIAEAMGENNVLHMGAAIEVHNFDAGKYQYSLRGYSESTPNDIREYNGTFTAPGNGFVMNGAHGFLFDLNLDSTPRTYVIKATLGGKDCALVSFAAPGVVSSTATGSATNGSTPATTLGSASGNTNASVQTFGQTTADLESAKALNLATNASSSGASETALLAESSMPTYLVYILIAIIGGLGGSVVYLITRHKDPNSPRN